jgi:hypothetical protein
MVSFTLLLAVGCAAEKREKKILKKTDSPMIHKNTMIKPSSMYEECLELAPGQIMEYSFRTSKPVDFNIHYHGEDKIYYPVSESNVTSRSGTLNVKEQEFYTEGQEYFCLMWENPSDKRVRLEFDCNLIQ